MKIEPMIFPAKSIIWVLFRFLCGIRCCVHCRSTEAFTKIHAYPGFYYRPKRSFGQGNIFTPVCHSFCSQGGYLTRQVPPRTRQVPPGTRQVPLPRPDPPWTRQVPPPDQTPPQPRQVPPESRHPPWTRQVPLRDQAGTPPHQTPPWTRQVPPREQTPPPDQTPPGPDTPPGSRHPPEPDTPPLGSSRVRNTVNARPVRILLECILVEIIILLNYTACQSGIMDKIEVYKGT